MVNNKEKISRIINDRYISKLIHLTRKKNLKSILKYGILNKEKLKKEKIRVYLDTINESTRAKHR